MADIEQTTENELEMLKARADKLGISYHPSIGAEKLREKINAALAYEGEQTQEAAVAKGPQEETEAQRRQRIMDEALKLVRIRVTCMNPAKKEIDGEIFTTGNAIIGTVRKYVPFNAPDGWHVPQIILNMLQERQFQQFYNEIVKNGVSVRRSRMVKEFAIEILPPLTDEELKDLAQQQAMAKRID